MTDSSTATSTASRPAKSPKKEAPVRLSVPVTPETHTEFAVQCIDLDWNIGARVIQMIESDMAGKIPIEFAAKQPNKADTHTKWISTNLPKALHKEFRKYCTRKGFLMTDHVERLILWDLSHKGQKLVV